MKKISFGTQVGGAVVLGIGIGKFFGSHASFLGELSSFLILLLKTFASPLIFFSIIDAILKTQIQIKRTGYLLVISTINATIAGLLVIAISHIFPHLKLKQVIELGRSLEEKKVEMISIHLQPMSLLNNFIPKNILDPFINNNVIGIVFLSILIGFALKKTKKELHFENAIKSVESMISLGLHLTQVLLHWVVKGIPLAIFGIVAKVVGTSGVEIFSTLSTFVLLIAGTMFLYVSVYYSFLILMVARKSLWKFYHHSYEPVLTAMTTGSSLATLPVTLRALQEKMKISPESSRLSACVGTNLNHDGILLYEALAALFIAHLSGITLEASSQGVLLLSSAMAAVGIAGVPEAGLITLTMVLGTVGLPTTWVPLLTTVDWFIGRLRATVNVISDMVVATVLDRLS